MTPPPEMIAELEQRNGLKGKLLADIPALADMRREWRRKAYRWADFGIAVTMFNIVLALANYPLWWLSALAAGMSSYAVWQAERFVWTMNKQLKRPAAEQVARDILGLWD